MNKAKKIQKEWDDHWDKVNKKTSIFGKFLEFHRYYIIAPTVNYYFQKYFPKKGTFVEMGSGTSQTSKRIIKYRRKLIAFDISAPALEEAKKIKQIDQTIQGDIFKSRFKNSSIDGIWNLGVMEHFTEKDIILILNEFHRVLKKGGRVILFWPPNFGSSEIVLVHIIENIVNPFRRLFGRKDFHFFPGEVSRIQSRKHVASIIKKSKLKLVATHFNYKDLFTHMIVVCEKE